MNVNLLSKIVTTAAREVVPTHISRLMLLKQAIVRKKKLHPKTEKAKLELYIEKKLVRELEKVEEKEEPSLQNLEEFYDLSSYSGITYMTEQIKEIYKKELHYYYIYMTRSYDK